VLIPVGSHCEDPWIAAIGCISNGRFLVNLVAGGDAKELAGGGHRRRPAAHARRPRFRRARRAHSGPTARRGVELMSPDWRRQILQLPSVCDLSAQAVRAAYWRLMRGDAHVDKHRLHAAKQTLLFELGVRIPSRRKPTSREI
jgi:hypothetical protein